MVNITALLTKACRDAGLNSYGDELPTNTTRPAQRFVEDGILAPSSHMPDWLAEYDVQADTWGNTKTEALTLLQAALVVLRAHPSNDYGAVTRFQLVGNDFMPDPDWPTSSGRPGPRYVSILRLHVHPAA